MSERSGQFSNEIPKIVASLATGQELVVADQIDRDLAEGISIADELKPISISELALYAGGANPRGLRTADLLMRIDALAPRFEEVGFSINFKLVEGEWKLWLNEHAEKEEPKTALAPIRAAVPALVSRIEDNIWETLKPLDRANLTEAFFRQPDETKKQIDEFVARLGEFRKGKNDMPTEREILEETSLLTKQEMAASRLKTLVTLSILEPEHPSVRTIHGWGRQLNDLILLLGGSSQGEELLFAAINSLDNVTRSLLLSEISMTKRYAILKVGMDQVNEREMAFFISQAVFRFYRSGDACDLEEIILTTMDRDTSREQFSTKRVIEAIFSHYPARAQFMFDQMIKASYQLDFGGHLMSLFLSHEFTQNHADKVDWEYGEEIDDFVPWNRRL